MILPVFLPHLGCGDRCTYCNQNHITQASDSSDLPDRLATLFGTVINPVEVALYSGNPLGLTPQSLDRLLGMFKPFSAKIEGFRLSAKPGGSPKDLIPILKSHNVHTIELGIPTFNDRILSSLCRRHTAADALLTYRLLASEGFRMGIQLMVGLPGESRTDLKDSVAYLENLKPSYVRVYPLVVLTDTPLCDVFKTGGFSPDSLEVATLKTSFIFARCWKMGIRVIKMGLTENEILRTSIVAGPYHPAFGYLVKSEVFRVAIESVCKREGITGSIMIYLSDRDISHFVGFRRSNLAKLTREGLIARWVTDDRLPAGHFVVEPEGGKSVSGDLSDSLATILF